LSNWLTTLFEHRWIRPWRHIAIFVITFLLVTSRRPDALFRAQFWGEDGNVFYADAYHLGWFPAVFHTHAGYFHLVPRLVAALALLVPLYRAPLLMNVIAIAAYALTVNLLLSSRSAAWGSLGFRALLAVGYLALPVNTEILGVFTDVQWVLVISALILVVGAIPHTTPTRIADVCFLLACGLSGPFCFFLLPIAVIVACVKRERWRWMPVGVLAFCAVIQAWALVFLSAGTRSAVLGATPYLFLRMLGENVFLAPFFGIQLVRLVNGTHAFLFELAVAAAGTILSLLALLRAQMETRLFCLLAAMVFAASLLSPAVTTRPGVPGWQLLAEANGIRYWFLPALAFLWLLIDAAGSPSKVLKSISAPLLLLFCLCGALQWKQPAFPDLHFAEEAARFESAPIGATVILPENPDGRTMRLVKHASVGH